MSYIPTIFQKYTNNILFVIRSIFKNPLISRLLKCQHHLLLLTQQLPPFKINQSFHIFLWKVMYWNLFMRTSIQYFPLLHSCCHETVQTPFQCARTIFKLFYRRYTTTPFLASLYPESGFGCLPAGGAKKFTISSIKEIQ